ncbi:MAG: hypothetical protein ACT4O1_05190 [Gemmatimonadota bacterium]
MDYTVEQANTEGDDPRNPPGIVILDRWEEPRRPVISAFIWGGKIRPVPAIPYGRAIG